MTDAMRVFYVDDEADIREVVAFALEDESDIRLTLCSNGAEALARIAGERPHLILLDVMMPGMDGPTVLRRLREQSDDVPVAFLTAKVQSGDIDHFRALGAVAVIAKPFDPMQLASKIREVLRQHTRASGT